MHSPTVVDAVGAVAVDAAGSVRLDAICGVVAVRSRDRDRRRCRLQRVASRLGDARGAKARAGRVCDRHIKVRNEGRRDVTGSRRDVPALQCGSGTRCRCRTSGSRRSRDVTRSVAPEAERYGRRSARSGGAVHRAAGGDRRSPTGEGIRRPGHRDHRPSVAQHAVGVVAVVPPAPSPVSGTADHRSGGLHHGFRQDVVEDAHSAGSCVRHDARGAVLHRLQSNAGRAWIGRHDHVVAENILGHQRGDRGTPVAGDPVPATVHQTVDLDAAAGGTAEAVGHVEKLGHDAVAVSFSHSRSRGQATNDDEVDIVEPFGDFADEPAVALEERSDMALVVRASDFDLRRIGNADLTEGRERKRAQNQRAEKGLVHFEHLLAAFAACWACARCCL